MTVDMMYNYTCKRLFYRVHYFFYPSGQEFYDLEIVDQDYKGVDHPSNKAKLSKEKLTEEINQLEECDIYCYYWRQPGWLQSVRHPL